MVLKTTRNEGKEVRGREEEGEGGREGERGGRREGGKEGHRQIQ